VGLWSMGLACLKGTGQRSGDPACLWIPGLTGLGSSPEEQRSCMCGSLAWQALGAQACRVNIVQGCAGFRGVAQRNGDHACLYLWWGRPWGCGPAKQRLQGCAGLGVGGACGLA
jgi:hypothetical protein